MRLSAKPTLFVPLAAAALLVPLAIFAASGGESRQAPESTIVHDKKIGSDDDLLLTIHRLGHPSIVIGVRG